MSATLRLYEIGDQMETIADQLVENGGELTPEIAQQLAALEGAFDRKLERILLYTRNLQLQGEVATVEAQRLQALAATRGTAAKRLRQYVMEQMERADREKVETALICARIQQNSRPSIEWAGAPDALPAEYQRVSVSMDGAKAYAQWKENGELPTGFTVVRGRHLRVS